MAKYQKDGKNIINKLEANNISAKLLDNSYQQELHTYLNFLKIIKPFVYIIIILFAINTFIFISKIINEKLLSFVILKLAGYTNVIISFNMFVAISIFTSITYIITNITLFSIFNIINIMCKIKLNYFLSYSIYVFCIENILILIIILFLTHRI